MISRRLFCSALASLGLLAATASHAQERFITVSSTTSTEQSGLFGHLLPLFVSHSHARESCERARPTSVRESFGQ